MPTDKLTHAQKDEIIAELKAQIAALEAAKAAPASSESSDFVSLGSVSSDGLLFFGGRAFSEGWAPEGSTHSEYALDFMGKDAERLARVAGAGQVIDLGKGTWRVLTPNRQYAEIKVQQVKRTINEAELKCTIVGYPRQCSRAQALDASRHAGFGMLRGALVLRNRSASVSGKIIDGKVTEIRVILD